MVPERAAFPDGLLEESVEIGAVSDRSARVWVRKPNRVWISGTLSVDGEIVARAETALSEETDWTGAMDLELEHPLPNARFKIDVDGATRKARFAPRPGETTGLTFGFGSCNRPFKLDDGKVIYHQAAGIYDALAKDLDRSDARFMILGGDQVYSDELEPISVRGINRSDHHESPPLDEVIESYRRITRGYLGVPGFKRVREQVPGYMIWDDHDIFDNWGSRKEVSDLDARLFEAATRVYSEYQQMRAPSNRTSQPPFHYDFTYGDIGFLVLDIRGQRDWKTGQLLGEQQWQEVIEYLEADDRRTNKDTLRRQQRAGCPCFTLDDDVARTCAWQARGFRARSLVNRCIPIPARCIAREAHRMGKRWAEASGRPAIR